MATATVVEGGQVHPELVALSKILVLQVLKRQDYRSHQVLSTEVRQCGMAGILGRCEQRCEGEA